MTTRIQCACNTLLYIVYCVNFIIILFLLQELYRSKKSNLKTARIHKKTLGTNIFIVSKASRKLCHKKLTFHICKDFFTCLSALQKLCSRQHFTTLHYFFILYGLIYFPPTLAKISAYSYA